MSGKESRRRCPWTNISLYTRRSIKIFHTKIGERNKIFSISPLIFRFFFFFSRLPTLYYYSKTSWFFQLTKSRNDQISLLPISLQVVRGGLEELEYFEKWLGVFKHGTSRAFIYLFAYVIFRYILSFDVSSMFIEKINSNFWQMVWQYFCIECFWRLIFEDSCEIKSSFALS